MTTLPTMNLFPFSPRHCDPARSGGRSNLSRQRGFTLIELLIVITLIGILAVAVLSALNPIEQVNKANDARKRGDSAQLLNAIDRYFAANLVFPWTEFNASGYGNDSAFGGAAYVQGVGVCANDNPVDTDGNADTAAVGPGGCAENGLLVQQDELKSAFTGKSYFKEGVADTDAGETFWVFKPDGDPTIYVCFKPSAKVNQDKAYDEDLSGNSISSLKHLSFTGDIPDDINQCDPGTLPLDLDEKGKVQWGASDDPEDWCFMCVPE